MPTLFTPAADGLRQIGSSNCMSVSHIPDKIKLRLWGKAAGRCEYEGCNRALWLDSLTKAEFNTAYIAHLIADKRQGPRGDAKLSKKLRAEITNLMLMCDEHHRLIDKEDVEGHPVQRLMVMKRRHEDRIEIQTSIQEDKRSHILLYGANIGEQNAPLSYEKASVAMVPERYPAEPRAIELSLGNSSYHDHETEYWQIEQEHLTRQFDSYIRRRLASGGVQHLSIFALAPQPLLMELGRLLSDIPAGDVYQLHREPADWKWQEHPEGFNYSVLEPDTFDGAPALNLSLSATINNDRIERVLGEPYSIWTMSIECPNNDFMKSHLQLEMFRSEFRRLLDKIKTKHGEARIIHLFPAVPASIAVEIGRIWMPKADLPIKVYEQNRSLGGFIAVLTLENKNKTKSS